MNPIGTYALSDLDRWQEQLLLAQRRRALIRASCEGRRLPEYTDLYRLPRRALCPVDVAA